MKNTVKNIALRSFLLLMALQILNVSIDAVDFQPLSVSDNISDFNYINSMTEYVSEIVLGHINSFPEYQQKTSKQSQNIKHIDFKIYHTATHVIAVVVPDEAISFILPSNEKYIDLFEKEINPQPPRA